MKSPILSTVLICSIAVAGCSRAVVPSALPGAHGPLRVGNNVTSSFRLLHSFPVAGAFYPYASLIEVNGVLYGTTESGGRYNAGTAFSVSKTGTMSVLHTFGGGNDGAKPVASLIDVNGTLYGTTQYGGINDSGTVFSLSTSGTERVLHSFGNGADGMGPQGSLIDVNGTLYGTTFGGGASVVGGTVFSISTSGRERVVHSFGGGSDGAQPEGSLIDVSGALYGTTSVGGGAKNTAGTVFSVSTTGKERILHSFGAGKDGAFPSASLIEIDGSLYGTTYAGGSGLCNFSIPSGCGIVFSLNAMGRERVLHAFKGGADGAGAYAPLIDVRGTLYGTTEFGGGGKCTQATYGGSGCGTAFSVSIAGAERVLYSFRGAGDGAIPLAGLIDVAGTLYGATCYGGASDAGTFFSLSTEGSEHLLYTFGPADGDFPAASLIDVNGTLYGTTEAGGGGAAYGGTVFSVSTTGTERAVHNFGGGTDGANPTASLTDVDGTLYGTTGGGGSGCEFGCGTAFSVSTAGTERVLRNFRRGKYGAYPAANLIDVNGLLYGTTPYNGVTASGEPIGDGTVFSMSTTGTEHLLYAFRGGADGASPQASLIDVNGTLFGTTSLGGASNKGTVFSVSTLGTERVLHSFGSGTDGQTPLANLLYVNGTLYGTTTTGGGASNAGIVFSLSASGAGYRVAHSFIGADGANPQSSLIDVKGIFYGTTRGGGAHGKGTVFSLTASGAESVVYSFNGADGEYPQAGLIDVMGTLYGTTSGGGAYYGPSNSFLGGTVFAVSP